MFDRRLEAIGLGPSWTKNGGVYRAENTMNDPIHESQLSKELESYQQEKPWRERQNVDAVEAKDDDESVSGQDATAASDAPIAETD